MLRKFCALVAVAASLVGAVAHGDEVPAFNLNEDNVDTTHDGKWADSDTYAIPTFYVNVQARRDAHVSNEFVHASAHVYIEGLDKATLQGLAKKAYDDLVAKIRAAGYKVLTYDDLKPDLAKLDRMQPNPKYGMPTTQFGEKRGGGKGDFVSVTPSDEQAIDFSELTGPTHPYNDIAKDKKVVVIVPQVYFAMPRVEKKKGGGWGFRRRTASIGMEPEMLLSHAAFHGLPPNLGWCSMMVKEHPERPAAEDVGTIETVHVSKSDEHDSGSWGYADGDYKMTVDPAKVSTGVLSVTYTLNTRLVKLIKKAH